MVVLTGSCGLAEFTVDESADALLRQADDALLWQKGQGENRVVVAEKPKSLWQTLKPFS